MKSRCEKASTRRASAAIGAHQRLAVDEAPRGDGGGAEGPRHRQAAEEERPRRVAGQAPADGHAGEDGLVHEVVAPEVEDGPAARLQEFQPGDLAVAAVEDGMGEEEEGARDLGQRVDGQEERRPQQADAHADQGDHVGRDRRPHQPAREGERERRSTCRDMKPSLALMRPRRSQVSAAATSARVRMAKRSWGLGARSTNGERPAQLGHQLVGRRRPGRRS